jgi:RNA polymerase sigma-70 factor (ECF subfamily)
MNVAVARTFAPRREAPESLTDVALLEGMFARDEAAWREFCRRYERLIWRCITKVTTRFGNVLSGEDVREIQANFLCTLMANDMRKLRLFRPEKGNRLGTWIGMLAINTAWDYLRCVARQPAGDPLSCADERPSVAPDPFEEVAQREDCTRVESLLRGFSQRDRTFVALYFLDGRSPEEVADEMGISVKTVYSKKHKIRTRLEKMLVERGLALAA